MRFNAHRALNGARVFGKLRWLSRSDLGKDNNLTKCKVNGRFTNVRFRVSF